MAQDGSIYKYFMNFIIKFFGSKFFLSPVVHRDLTCLCLIYMDLLQWLLVLQEYIEVLNLLVCFSETVNISNLLSRQHAKLASNAE